MPNPTLSKQAIVMVAALAHDFTRANIFPAGGGYAERFGEQIARYAFVMTPPEPPAGHVRDAHEVIADLLNFMDNETTKLWYVDDSGSLDYHDVRYEPTTPEESNGDHRERA